jgi:hypothetical protein
MTVPAISPEDRQWLASLTDQIRNSRARAALAVNSEMILLYWRIGQEIMERQERHGWGTKIMRYCHGAGTSCCWTPCRIMPRGSGMPVSDRAWLEPEHPLPPDLANALPSPSILEAGLEEHLGSIAAIDEHDDGDEGGGVAKGR